MHVINASTLNQGCAVTLVCDGSWRHRIPVTQGRKEGHQIKTHRRFHNGDEKQMTDNFKHSLKIRINTIIQFEIILYRYNVTFPKAGRLAAQHSTTPPC